MSSVITQGLSDGGVFLKGSAGSIFVRVVGQPQRLSDRCLMIIPPFAEEMNKSRRMLSLMAEMLAKRGYSVLLPDLFGCGDSHGDFAEARLAIWQDDCRAILQQLREEGVKAISLLGVRSGALLAVDLCSNQEIDNLLLWQPVVKGLLFMKQFLRLRMAADLIRAGSASQSVEEAFEQYGGVEVAGYWLAQELHQAILEMNLSEAPNLRGKLAWYELSTQQGASLSLPARQLIERWRESGLTIDDAVLEGDSFWSTSEITTSASLLQRSCDFLLGQVNG